MIYFTAGEVDPFYTGDTMLYISATLADKLLPVAARGDIEGAILALIFNVVIFSTLGYAIVKSYKLVKTTYTKHKNRKVHSL